MSVLANRRYFPLPKLRRGRRIYVGTTRMTKVRLNLIGYTVEFPAAILALTILEVVIVKNSKADRDLINSAKEFEIDKVAGSIVHIDADSNRQWNSRSITFTDYKSNI